MCTILDYAQILFIDKSLEGMRNSLNFLSEPAYEHRKPNWAG